MFKRLLFSSLDHILFTLSFLIGVQLPEFIQQYTQLINGKLAEANFHLSKFQSVADIHFNGDLRLLMSRYQENNDPAISQTGKMVAELEERVTYLEHIFTQLTQSTYLEKIYYFTTQLDIESATLVVQHYVLAIPLNIEALVTGAVCALLMMTTKLCLYSSCKKIYCRLFHRVRRKSF